MTMTMYQSDRNFVSPANDASLYSAITNEQAVILDRGNKLNVTVNGLTATVSTGQVIIKGRLIEVLSPETITLPAGTSGKIVVTVDLTKQNDAVGNIGDSSYSVTVNQTYLSVITTDNLTQDDINNGGFVYQLPIANFTSSSTSATASIIQNLMFDTGWMNIPLVSNNRFVGSDSYAQYRLLNGLVHVRIKGLDVSKSQNGNQIGSLTPIFSPGIALYEVAQTWSASKVEIIGINVRKDGFMYIDFTGAGTRSNINANFSYPLA